MTRPHPVYVLHAAGCTDCPVHGLTNNPLFSLHFVAHLDDVGTEQHTACVIACCTGIDDLPNVARRLPNLPPVICHAKSDNAANCAAAFRLGFFDYVIQSENSDPLVKSILRAFHLNNRKPNPVAAGSHRAMVELTPRERDVLEHLIRGKLNKVTAAELGISEKTVKVHRARIFEKLKVANVVGLIHLCYALGIVPKDLPASHPDVRARSAAKSEITIESTPSEMA